MTVTKGENDMIGRLSVIVLCALGFPTYVLAGVGDSVLSADIKEADGTSGQNTNAGSGVKTGHLQDASVTTSKIADSAVTTSKVGDAAITTPKIGDGAVTDAKIAGPISASKIASVGLNADTVDGYNAADFAVTGHTHDGTYEKRYANVIVVSKDGRGDFLDPAAALDSITTAAIDNPFLIKMMPGVYELPPNRYLIAKSYVDVEGSGAGITRIISSSLPVYVSRVQNVEFRDVTIEGQTTILSIVDSSSFRLTDAQLVCPAGSPASCTPAMADWLSTLTLTRVVIDAPHVYKAMVVSNQAAVRMFGGRVGAPAGIVGNPVDSNGAFYGAGVQFDGTVFQAGYYQPSPAKCVACYTAAFDPISIP